MRLNLGSVLLGGLLVAAGLGLAHAPSWVAPAQAGVAPEMSNWMVTCDDGVPGRIYVWHLQGSGLQSVTVHDCSPSVGTVTSQSIEPRAEAGSGIGR
jgi:hypothetical protein